MSKRKGVSESDEALSKKLKAECSSDNSSSTKFSFDSPEQCFLSVIYPTTIQNFFDKNWEKEPLFIQRKSTEYYGDLWTKENFEAIAKKTKLMYNEDVSVFRYSKKDEPAIEAEGRVTLKSLQKYWKDMKATVMLLKPHRFCEKLHSLQHLLESYFGCCAYASLLVVPEDSQGRAPGYTQGEEFILQVEGKACWRLYKPMQELSNEDSEDLDESEIGDVVHEYELQPGDLLYFPRGTVFQASSLAGHHSTHLSVQLYIESHWGRFLSIILNKAVVDATKNDVSFRQGLPVNFLSYMSYGKKQSSIEQPFANGESTDSAQKGKAIVPKLDKSEVDKQKSFQEKLQEMCNSLVHHVDPHWAADIFGKLFIEERLPPFTKTPVYPNGETSDQPPGEESLVQMTYPDHVRIVLYEAGHEDSDEDDFIEDDDTSEEENNIKKEDKDGQKKSDAKNESENNSKKSKRKSKEENEEKNGEEEEKEEEEKKDEEDEDMGEGDSSIELDKTWSDEPCVVVQHSLHNGESDKDILDKGPGLIKFPVHYKDALLILHRSTKPVAVKDLPLDASDDRVELAMTLWAERLLEAKEAVC